jgi:hypothetical protein
MMLEDRYLFHVVDFFHLCRLEANSPLWLLWRGGKSLLARDKGPGRTLPDSGATTTFPDTMRIENKNGDHAWFLQQVHLAFRHLQLAAVSYIGRPDYAAAVAQARREVEKEENIFDTYIRDVPELTTPKTTLRSWTPKCE